MGYGKIAISGLYYLPDFWRFSKKIMELELGPKVSVCTPVFNGGKFLDNCIKGVLNQTYRDFEYIIVDNASTDNTADIIERYRKSDSRIRAFRNNSTIPVIDNFNKCIEHISPDSEWIKYALADDMFFPYCIEEMLKLGMQDPQIGIVSAYRLYGTSLHYLGLPMNQNIFDGAYILKQQILHKFHVCSGSPNSLMYRRDIFDELGGFHKDYLHADTKLAYQLLDKYKLGFIHDVLTWTGDHEGRVEVASIKAGRNIKEYLDFGYKDIDSYKSISLSEAELNRVKDFYAGRLLEFRIKRLADFHYRLPESMSEWIPPEISARYSKVLQRKWRQYARLFLSALKRAIFK